MKLYIKKLTTLKATNIFGKPIYETKYVIYRKFLGFIKLYLMIKNKDGNIDHYPFDKYKYHIIWTWNPEYKLIEASHAKKIVDYIYQNPDTFIRLLQ